MLEASYTWRPIGTLLIERGLLTQAELEAALAEQKRSGRLVGEILVESGCLSAFSLARALTEQHGVELQTKRATEVAPAEPEPTVWRPLGRLLVEEGYLTRTQLREALAQQRASEGRRLLGEILVAEGLLSGFDLARALAQQNGVALEESEEPVVEAVLHTAEPREVVYQVCEVTYQPRYAIREALYESPSLLEAIDYATEYIEDTDPEGIEIKRLDGPAPETVWTYSDSRAAAAAAKRKDLAQTFGFDPTLWGSAATG